MIFSQRHAGIGQRSNCGGAVQPRRCDETRDRLPRYILKQCSTAANAFIRLRPIKTQKFALAGCHKGRARSVPDGSVRGFISMIEAVQEDFETGAGPAAQLRGKRRPGNDRRLLPMVRNDEQGQTASDVRLKHVKQAIDFALKARCNVVDRRKKAAFGGHPSKPSETHAAVPNEQCFT